MRMPRVTSRSSSTPSSPYFPRTMVAGSPYFPGKLVQADDADDDDGESDGG